MSEAIPIAGDGQSNAPYFSIIVPMYNRAHTIRRCLDSCLKQDFGDYEIIVIDDASDEDDSVGVVASYTDPRIRLITSVENRGVCAARGLGVRHARGQWLVFIGSDDSFQDDAFERIYRHAQRAPDEVGEVRFCYWCEALAQVNPRPSLPLGVIGFTDYLLWLDTVENSDALYCHRRTIYEHVSWPTDRRFETKFHLDVAASTEMLMTDVVVATVHDDAGNRLTGIHRGPVDAKTLQTAYDNAVASEEILSVYGAALATHCPLRYQRMRRMVGNLYFRAGYRIRGTAAMLRYLSRRPLDVVAWGLLLLGLIGPRTLHLAIRLGKWC